jgi:hypothetical protein
VAAVEEFEVEVISGVERVRGVEEADVAPEEDSEEHFPPECGHGE